jgi:phage terminase small subunit
MPRPRKPTELHALSGALEKNPGRYADRKAEPQDDRALGPPPEWLAADAKAAWLELERISAPGVLRIGDRIAVEIAALLIARLRRAGDLMPEPELRRLQSLLGELGLSPASRSKVQAGPVKATNPFEKFKKPPAKP